MEQEQPEYTPEVTNPRLYELYKNECTHTGVKPTIKDYLLWLDENDYLESAE